MKAGLSAMVVLAVLVMPILGASAETRISPHRHHYSYRHHPVVSAEDPMQPRSFIAESDSNWRHRSARGWDNTCFHTAWLANQFACDAR